MYYYIDPSGHQQGPFTAEQLITQALTPNTYIWHEGLAEWTAAKMVPEVAALLTGATAE